MLLKHYAILVLMASLMKRTTQKTSKGTISQKCAKAIQKAIKAYGFEMVEQFLDSDSTEQQGVLEMMSTTSGLLSAFDDISQLRRCKKEYKQSKKSKTSNAQFESWKAGPAIAGGGFLLMIVAGIVFSKFRRRRRKRYLDLNPPPHAPHHQHHTPKVAPAPIEHQGENQKEHEEKNQEEHQGDHQEKRHHTPKVAPAQDEHQEEQPREHQEKHQKEHKREHQEKRQEKRQEKGQEKRQGKHQEQHQEEHQNEILIKTAYDDIMVRRAQFSPRAPKKK